MKKFTTNMLLFLGIIVLTSSQGSAQKCCTARGYVDVENPRSDVAEAFEEYRIVPDYIPVAPKDIITSEYFTAPVKFGNYIAPVRAQFPKIISYPNAEADKLYTLVLLDIDHPSRQSPTMRGLLHGLTVNIKGRDELTGEDVVPFYPASPRLGTGLHRYIALMYVQKDTIDANDLDLLRTTRNRGNFSVVDFAETYSLGDPVAGNFFQTSVDDCLLV